MIPAHPTPDESQRLKVLRQYGVLDTAPEQALDDLTLLATQFCGTAMGAISLVDEKRLWFKSKVGLEVSGLARENSFCSHAIAQRGLFEVSDAAQDERFACSPLVTGEPGIRFYAAIPLIGAEGAVLGTLAVFDPVPREMTPEQRNGLRVLGHQVMVHLELRRRLAEKEELLKRDEQFRLYVEQSPVAIAMLDRDMNYLVASEHWRADFGLGNQPLVGRNHYEVFPEIPQRWKDIHQRCLAGATEKSDEDAFVRGDGTVEWLRWEVRPWHWVDDGIGGIIMFAENITERKRSEDALKLFRTLVDRSTDAIEVIDAATGRYLDVNETASQRLGYTRQEMLKLQISDVVIHSRPFSLAEAVAEVKREGFKIFEDYHRRKDGSVFPIEANVQYIHLDRGYLIAIVRDITERKRAAEALQESEGKFRLLAENISDVFWIASPDFGGIYYVSPAYRQVWGRSEEELYARPKGWLDAIVEEDRPRVQDALGRLARDQKSVSIEYRIQRPDGTIRWVHDRGFQVYNASGRLAHITGIVTDITARKKVEREILWKTAFFEAQVHSALDGILVVDDTGRKVMQNQRMVDMWSIPPEFVHELDDRKQREWVSTQLKDPRKFIEKVEYLYAHPDEVSRDELELVDGRIFDRYSAPVRGLDGKYYGRIWSFRDNTERKHAEEARRASEVRYRTLFDYAPDGIVIADGESTYLDANASMCRMLGYTWEEFVGLNARDIILPREVPEIRGALDAIKAKTEYPHEWTFCRKDGSTFVADVIATQMPDGNLLAMIRDMTERKKAEEQIAEQAAFLDKARDAILVRDLTGKILFWNKGAERMYGWTREEAVGRNVGQLLYADPAIFEDANGQTIAQGEWQGELQHRTKDRHGLTIEARWTLVRDDAGQPKSILVINTDITEKKKIESQFLRAQRMESIGTLAGGIAHDLNNILAPIMMSIDLLKLHPTESDSKLILETIEVSAKRGADIVRQVLSFARGLEGHRSEVQLKNLLKDLETIIKDTFPKDIQLHFDVPSDTWTIFGDPTQVHQILLNLCVNARDAMPNGGVLTVRLKNAILDEHYAAMKSRVKAGRYVNVSVTDTGTGITPQLLDKIFDPFFTTKELNKGTGLGLSTVLAIVKSHEGLIDVTSEPGRGTTFNIYLPAMDMASMTVASVAESDNLPRGNGETILVVDDEASVIVVTSQTLQAFGYRVLTATDGADAVAVYAQNRREIAVVLTDMMMPIMDGPAMINALTRMNPGVKIVAASGLMGNANAAKIPGTQVKHFLTKPYTASTLLKILKTILSEG